MGVLNIIRSVSNIKSYGKGNLLQFPNVLNAKKVPSENGVWGNFNPRFG